MIKFEEVKMYFDGVKKNFGFGMMRLPMIDKDVDIEQTKAMVDYFMEAGFNYFDTAHVYIEGKSEQSIKTCLTERYDREDYILTDKLSNSNWEKREDIRPLVDQMLEACGVEYFDFLLMHALNKDSFKKYRDQGAFEEALALKEEGKIRHLGMSFHDSAEVLDQILTEIPQVEVVQIQFNYLDQDDDNVQSRACYEVCRKHGKPIIVMEPVKGGTLANLPAIARKEFEKLSDMSPASYAIRYVASHEGIFMILSGMSNMEQMKDNVSFMKDFKKLDSGEMQAIETVTKILKDQDTIACTACRYCVDGCPMGILIPDLFMAYNNKKIFGSDEQATYDKITETSGLASACIECGQCEGECPQSLKIITLLKDVALEFEQ